MVLHVRQRAVVEGGAVLHVRRQRDVDGISDYVLKGGLLGFLRWENVSLNCLKVGGWAPKEAQDRVPCPARAMRVCPGPPPPPTTPLSNTYTHATTPFSPHPLASLLPSPLPHPEGPCGDTSTDRFRPLTAPAQNRGPGPGPGLLSPPLPSWGHEGPGLRLGPDPGRARAPGLGPV